MSKFDDLINNPLPSSFLESDDDMSLFDETDEMDAGYTDDTEEDCCGEDDDSDFDDDEISDEISNVLDDEDEIDPELIGEIENDEDDEDDEDDDEDLTPDQEKEVEDETSLIATPIILKDELTAEEYADFGESVDADIAIDEGLLLESDISDIFNDTFTESIKPMRFSRESVLKARTNQIHWIVIRTMARKKNNPLLVKLEKCYKIRRNIRARLEATYGSKADVITKRYIQRLKSSKSGVLSSIGKKLGIKH